MIEGGYEGILFFGQNLEFAGRGIAGPRLRTAARKAGYNILALDFLNDITVDQIFQIIDSNISTNTKFVGFSLSWIDKTRMNLYKWYSPSFFQTLKLRWPQLLIITGGHDEWRHDLILSHSNYHFHGYSDNTFVEFLKHINGLENHLVMTKNILTKGLVIDSNISDPVVDPNDLETVFEKEDGFLPHQPLPIEIARGCIFRCSFCHHPFQGKKEYDSYQRKPENIAKELRRNYELFGTTRYTILDDTFNDSIEKLDRLATAIKLAELPNFQCVAYIKAELLVTKPEMIEKLGELGLRGAFIGFESFSKEARKAVGKGTDITKVIDACRKLSEYNNGQILIHGSWIVGLPGDTAADIDNVHLFILNNPNFIKSWVFQALHMRDYPDALPGSASEFDKNPTKYGYTILPNSHEWKSSHFNSLSAHALVSQLEKSDYHKKRSGGWRVAGMWHAGKTEEEISNDIVTFGELERILKTQSIARASSEVTRLTCR